MGKMAKLFSALMMFGAVCFGSFILYPLTSSAGGQEKFTVAWSHYTGWEPWAYADETGIIKKWADKFGIQINVVLVNDYMESINIYTAGAADACAMTNMDALSVPSVGGIDSTVLIIGDFSNGNDGLATNAAGVNRVQDLKGKEVKLVLLSVSHYALARWLDMSGLRERDIKLVNVSDADIGGVFLSQKECNAVTWNPILMTIRNSKGAKVLADSSQIPGEIIDMMVVKTNTPDSFKKALTGAWFETMEIISGKGKAAEESIRFMAEKAGSTAAEFKVQLSTTAMFYGPQDAVVFAESDDLKKTMEYVRTFSFDHGLYGEGAVSKDLVGIRFPDGTIIGDPRNVKLRFDSAYMQMAADGSLK